MGEKPGEERILAEMKRALKKPSLLSGIAALSIGIFLILLGMGILTALLVDLGVYSSFGEVATYV